MNPLSITNSIDNQTLTLVLSGRIDTQTSPEFEAAIKESLEANKAINKLVLDFTEIDYISSAGLRVLLSAHKSLMKKEGLTLMNVNPSVYEIFEVTGFNSILDIK